MAPPSNDGVHPSHHRTYGSRIRRFANHLSNRSLHQLKLFRTLWKGYRYFRSLSNFRKDCVQSFLGLWVLRFIHRLVAPKYYDFCWLLRFANSWLRRSPQVMASSFTQFLPYLHLCTFVILGRYNDVLAYPCINASYTVPVRQYRVL